MEHLKADTAIDDESRSTDGDSPSAGVLAALDRRFERLVKQASADNALDEGAEDEAMPALLAAGPTCAHPGVVTSNAYKLDPPPSSKPALHARLRETLDLPLEDERHWSIPCCRQRPPDSACLRIRVARTMASTLTCRNAPCSCSEMASRPCGPNMTAITSAFHDAGGRTLAISVADLRGSTLARAAERVHREPREWLRDRKLTSSTELLNAVFAGMRIRKRAQP
jgi:hypothetical protein